MRIIGTEEHVTDAPIAAATAEASHRQAPYTAAVGSRHHDDPDTEPQDRPRFRAMSDALRLAAAPIEDRLPAMDAAGIDMHVLSIGSSPQLAPAGNGLSLARAANDRLAAAVRAHPDRFSAFFTLPWQDPEAAAAEARRCVHDLGLPGTLLNGRPAQDAMIDDARFEPTLAALAELDAPLYIHPGPPLAAVQQPYYSGFNDDLSARLSLFGWGWHNEAGIQVLRLILSGALDRYPSLKIISGHWGEMVPFFLQRLDDMVPQAVTGLSRTITTTYRDQVWIGPSGMLTTPHFIFVRSILGTENIVFSVDYPFLTMTGARAWLENLPISDDERQAIAHGNIEALLHLDR